MGDKNKRSRSDITRPGKTSKESHKIVWSKVNHGAPKCKHNKLFWVSLQLTKQE